MDDYSITQNKINQSRGMKFEQPSNSTLPKKHPQLSNPSTEPIHPEGSNYTAASPWSSKFAMVPSRTPFDLHIFCHQDSKYALGWQHTSQVI